MLIVIPVDWTVIAVPPALPVFVPENVPPAPPVPWMSPEWFIVKVPPILAGTVVIPKTTLAPTVYILGTVEVQLPEAALLNRVCKLTLDALDAVTLT